MKKIAIVAAMKEEIAPFQNYYEPSEVVFEKGKAVIEKVSDTLFLVQTGIGKANAAACTAWLCEMICPDVIINTGTTGSFDYDTTLGDVVIGDVSQYSDVDATGFGYVWGQVPQMPDKYVTDEVLLTQVMSCLHQQQFQFNVHRGTIVTSDSFMSSKEFVADVRSKIPTIFASDMESTAIVQIATFYHIPVLNIRGISDHVGESAPDTFEKMLPTASKNAFDVVRVAVDCL